LGCGTGRVLEAIAKCGSTVYGIDREFEMLSFLSKTLPDKVNARVHVLQAQMYAFHFGMKFGKILLPCNTYSTLTPGERCAALSVVFHHLDEEGVFVFSIPNPAVLYELPEQGEPELEAIISQPDENLQVQVYSSWERTKECVKMFWHYDYLKPDGSIKRVTVCTQHYLTSKGRYMNELREAGFMDLTIYGDYDYASYDRYSPYLIMIAGK
jgi:SAM-dependent methyltransferase